MFVVWYLISIFIGVIMARSVIINRDKSDGVHLTSGGLAQNFGDIEWTDVEINGVTRTDRLSLDNANQVNLHAPQSRHVSPHQDHTHGSLKHVNTTFTPEYMLELYEKLSKSPPLAHTSNIIRSFQNIAKEGRFHP